MLKKNDVFTLRITCRELATVLAALRFHQDENLQGGRGIPDAFLKEIATDGGTLSPLDFQEVSSLCQRINIDAAAPQAPVLTLFEVEKKGHYHQHWLAGSHREAAQRAVSHAQECGLTLDRVNVSSMVRPEDAGKGGLVYVVNDTRPFAVERGRIRRIDSPGKPHARPSARQK